jgi:nitroreductase
MRNEEDMNRGDSLPISRILRERTSCRSFLPQPVDPQILRKVLEDAQRAPSNKNGQPCHVFIASGETRIQLEAQLVDMAATSLQATRGNGSDPNMQGDFPGRYVELDGVYKERQYGAARALYGALGVQRADMQGRVDAMLANWRFFGAPHVAFFAMDRRFGLMPAVDVGIYAQTLALLMAERGISSCMQGALGSFSAPVRMAFNVSDQLGILFGMSFGYSDTTAPVNRARTERASLADVVCIRD